ncbi:alpha/beta fold hydrolase [bacterium]|nr:alpha/beta fold hydrolase [bacterium]
MPVLFGLLIVAVIVAIALLAMQVGINRSVMQMMEQSPPLHAIENDPAPEAEPFSFQTADGLTLQGAVYPPTDQSPRGLVLFFHELGGDQWSASSYCDGLLNAGFAVVTFAFRNHGNSDRLPNYDALHWLSEHELADIRAFLTHLNSRADLSSLPWTAFGVSRGGGAALIAAAECPRIRGVLCESAYSTLCLMSTFSRRWVELFVPRWALRLIPGWHVELTLASGRLFSEFRRGVRYLHLERFLPKLCKRPVLLISGQRDSYVTPQIATSLQQSVGDHSRLWMVSGARHNRSREVDASAYDARLVAFVEQLCGNVDEPAAIEPAHHDRTVSQN